MADFSWDRYALLQAELRDKHTVGDRSWGVEAGLNYILSAEPAKRPLADDEIQRAVSSGQRRERHRASLCRLHLTPQEAGSDPETFLQARAELKEARAKVAETDWRLLCAVAVGREYGEIAIAKGSTVGALRVRVSRLRREIAQIPAPREPMCS